MSTPEDRDNPKLTQGDEKPSAVEIKAKEDAENRIKQAEEALRTEQQKNEQQFQAVVSFTLPPQGVRFLGSVIRLDINGQVIIFETDSNRQNTVWKTNEGKIIACPSMLLMANTIPELQKIAHERIDKVVNAWYQAHGITQPIMPEIIPNEPVSPNEPTVHENQPSSEASDSIVKGKSEKEQAEPEGQTLSEESPVTGESKPPKPTKTIELNVVSSMAESTAEPNK